MCVLKLLTTSSYIVQNCKGGMYFFCFFFLHMNFWTVFESHYSWLCDGKLGLEVIRSH